MTNACAYLRCSTLGQDLSPDAQRAAILAYAARSGLTVTSFHEDLGVSGATPVADRPGLMAALSALKVAGRGSALIVAKRDRLARSVLVAATAEGLVKRLGCTIVSADGMGAGDGPEAVLMRTILDAFGEFERALIRARTRAALAVRRAKGLRISGEAPFGSRFGPGGRLEAVPAEQATVDRAVALHASGLSAHAVAIQLAAEGVRGRTGQPIPRSTVARWLRRQLAAVAVG